MATISECFCGKVEEREYSQIIGVEMVPAVYVDGKPTSWRRNLAIAKTTEQIFRFEGLTDSQAHTASAVTVTDVSGSSYTVPMAGSVTDGSSGTAAFEKESVSVSRRRISPHLWEVVVVRRGAALFVNGSCVVPAPAWV